MHYSTVYKQDGVFAGWPANHGGWQWGNELLVGFLTGVSPTFGYAGQEVPLHHNIVRPFTKLQARSLNGGATWTVEQPGVDFNCSQAVLEPAPEFTLGGDTIIRVCGTYDTGGEDCHPDGGFYLSRDRGRTWSGPYAFTPLCAPPNEHFTGRTCVSGDSVFVSIADRKRWGSDYVMQLTTNEHGEFRVYGIVHQDTHRTVMPAAARLDYLDRTVVVCRRKGDGRNWIDAYISSYDCDFGRWRPASSEPVAETGGHNGNPPALINVGDSLYCAYGNRTRKTIEVVQSKDGITWGPPVVLRESSNQDLGYPRLFLREDGLLVCVYYVEQYIEARLFEPWS